MTTVVICLLMIIAGIAIGFMLMRSSCKQNKLRIKLFLNNLIIEGKNIMVSMSYSQKVSVELSTVDSNGNPAPVEPGSVQVSSSDESICKVLRDPEDETKFEILGANDGTVGVAQVDISADADLGSGIETITGFIGVEITPKQAVGFGFNIGEPVEQ